MKEKPYFLNPDGTPHYVDSPPTLKKRLAKEKTTRPIDDVAKDLGVGVEFVKHAVDELKEEGYGIGHDSGVVIRTKARISENVFDASKLIDKDFQFGIVGDTHLSSKKERLDEIEKMYDIFEREGVSIVFHTGDITEGVGVYRGQELEVKHHGQTEQVEYAVENYPSRDGIKTVFITGNHDLRAYERGGYDVGIPIANERRDMDYAGQAIAEVKLPNNVKMELLHPDGGTAYALSYKAQRYINNLNPQDVPDMMVWGHYHTTFYMHYRNVHFLQTGCFKDAGIWEKRKGLNPTIGGWLVEGKISDYGDVTQFKPELFTFSGKDK